MNSAERILVRALVIRRTIVLFGLISIAAAAISAADFISTRTAIPAAHPRFGIDPNTATWFELATLPRVGRATADQIITFRETRAAAPNPDRPIFRSPADLDAVPGIGPKTVTRLAPHLRFPSDAGASPAAAD